MQKGKKQMKHNEGRRKFCKVGLAGIGTVFGAAAIGGGAVFLGSPALTNLIDGQWIEVGSMDDFEEGTYAQVILEFEIQDGWAYASERKLAYVRKRGEDVVAISAVCTHLGCNVRFEEERNEFVCPCHAGIYDENGVNIAGPPPAPLVKLPIKVEDGTVYIYNKDKVEETDEA
jgi:quinol---cytochrome c reductase iron-sulfur subunit, bacillus type